jgi:flagellar hook-associated protein 3 FlgL
MTTRTTLQSFVNTAILNIELNAMRLQNLQEQISTGKKISKPSDDPAGARKIVDLRSEASRLDIYSKNIETATASLDFTASTLQNATDAIQRIKELTVQGVNGTQDQASRDSIAIEINGFLEAILQNANTQLSGKYIFSGTETQTEPFAVTRGPNGEISSVTYNGNNEKIEYQVGPGINAQINQPGREVFMDSGLFNAIITIRDNLRLGATTNVEAQMDNLDNSFDNVVGFISKAGGVSSSLELASNRIEDSKLSVADILASTEGADITELVLRLKEQENVYQAALASTALIFNNSILDYM